MDVSAMEKNKNNFIAFISGGLFFGAIVCTVASYLHTQKVDILETSLRESDKKLKEAQLSLEREQKIVETATAQLKARQGAQARKQELNSLLNSVDKQVAAKKKELSYMSPLSNEDPKDDLYMRTEGELKALLQQRNDILSELIHLPAAG